MSMSMGMGMRIYSLLGGDGHETKVWYQTIGFVYGDEDTFFLWGWIWDNKIRPRLGMSTRRVGYG